MVEIFGRTKIYRDFVKAGCRYCIIHTDFVSCMSVIQYLLPIFSCCNVSYFGFINAVVSELYGRGEN
jgi:hypothetical protein